MSYQRFVWFDHYYTSIKKIADKSPYFSQQALMLALIVLPIILSASLVYLLLCSILWGFPGFLAQIALFYYCLGPKNPFYPDSDMSKDPSDEVLIGSYLAQVNNQLFAVVFWYLVAGPIAALFFRLFSLARDITQVAPLAHTVTDLLEWIPARITALLYLLVGNFQAGFKTFISYLAGKPSLNNPLLSECGLLALRSNNPEESTMPATEQLVEHAGVVLLVVIALCTLAAWL
jgi:AmpE protein